MVSFFFPYRKVTEFIYIIFLCAWLYTTKKLLFVSNSLKEKSTRSGCCAHSEDKSVHWNNWVRKFVYHFVSLVIFTFFINFFYIILSNFLLFWLYYHTSLFLHFVRVLHNLIEKKNCKKNGLNLNIYDSGSFLLLSRNFHTFFLGISWVKNSPIKTIDMNEMASGTSSLVWSVANSSSSISYHDADTFTIEGTCNCKRKKKKIFEIESPLKQVAACVLIGFKRKKIIYRRIAA